jgi:hypothetical protein
MVRSRPVGTPVNFRFHVVMTASAIYVGVPASSLISPDPQRRSGGAKGGFSQLAELDLPSGA